MYDSLYAEIKGSLFFPQVVFLVCFHKLLRENFTQFLSFVFLFMGVTEATFAFPAKNKKGNEHLEEFIQSLSDQIFTLKGELKFLGEELKEKDHVIKLLPNMRCKPSENCGTIVQQSPIRKNLRS